jgi:hypothetical protein
LSADNYWKIKVILRNGPEEKKILNYLRMSPIFSLYFQDVGDVVEAVKTTIFSKT